MTPSPPIRPLVAPLSPSEREAFLLAPYAMFAADSTGRRHAEAPHPYRAAYQRDRDRIIHSTAYRRLSGKTQVFTGERGDYHRTRLTHTHEVTSIARTLGRTLRLNEDLIEACALLHDLGHPPFGHAGEDVLDECLRPWGGFNHNAHTLRIVELLERRYPEFPGLNLSAEVLEGQRFRTEKERAQRRPLLEVQVVDAADSVAYDAHDADDALELKLITLDDLQQIPLWRQCRERIEARYAALDDRERKRVIVHELIDRQVGDLVDHVRKRLESQGIDSTAAVRAAPRLAEPGPDMAAEKIELERFLFQRVYRHPEVLAERRRVQAQLQELFDTLVRRPDWLPIGFQSRLDESGLERTVGDFIAGMTDRYALNHFQRHVAEGRGS